MVSREDIVKGYEFSKGQYVLFNDEELKTLQETKKSQRDALQAEVKQLRDQITQGQFSLSEDKLAEIPGGMTDYP